MKIQVYCGKGPGGVFIGRCQGHIELTGSDFEPGLIVQLITDFYAEHAHEEESPPDDRDPASRIVEVTDDEWNRAQIDGIGLVEEGTG